MADTTSSIFQHAFDDKHVVIVGGAQGIGRAIADGFVRSGASVWLSDLKDDVHETAKELQVARQDVRSTTLDVTKEDQVKSLFAEVAKEWGTLDVLVNNAGTISIKKLEDTPAKDFETVLAVNTVGQFIAAREAYPLLRKANGGSIINAASGQARQGFIYTPSYAASKFGVMGLTQSLAKELAPHNIRVNAYCPGIVPTAMWNYDDREWGRLLGGYAPGEYFKESVESIPMGRPADASDVANLVLFLASDAGSYITGQAINVDGGMFMN